jgi:hypothetical protein
MRIEARASDRALGATGLVVALVALVLAIIEPGAMTGWLGAAAMIQALPMTAAILLLAMRLIAGVWEPMLRPVCEAALLVLPLAALAFVPVLIGLGALYPWAAQPLAGFKGAWLTPGGFVLRTILWFALLGLLAWRGFGRRPSAALASVGLILITAFGSLAEIDWLMTLDPDFVSSGFGLQVIAIGVCGGYGALLAARLLLGPAPARTGVLGGLFLTLLLIWAYFQFLTYLIVWSGNLAGGADWYLPRGEGLWGRALLLASALGGVPLLALLLPGPRTGARWLVALGLAAAVGRAIEFAWIAIPPGGGWALLVFLLAASGFAAAAAALLRAGCRGRIAP